MRTWVALFRGINVGGNRVLPMKDLVATLENAGAQDIETYIQSGNAVFRSQETDAPCFRTRSGPLSRRATVSSPR